MLRGFAALRRTGMPVSHGKVFRKKDFVMTFNAGWHRQLGFQTSMAGSYEA
jgi:hypothetical protein